MILLVDVGNTRIKWRLWEQDRTGPGGSLLHKGLAPTGLGERLWSDLKRPSQVMIANVAGADMATALRDWTQQAWQLEPRFATTAASGYGVSNAYAIPAQMGVDRWVAMIGARARLSQSCCIVDCGTAVTVDALTAEGQHLGGVIFPGVRLMREALYRDTRQIPAEDQGQPTVFGQSTRDCVWGGTTYAVAAAIDGIAERMEEKLPGETQRLLTGGDADLLLPYLRGRYRLEPELIFQGLLVMAGQQPAP
jgi:type III pantothenate kinase